MEGVQNSDVATLSLLGNGGYGPGGDRYGNYGGFAHDGSVINAKVEANRDTITQQHDSLSQQISDAADRTRDAAESDRTDNHFESLTDKLNDQTRFFAQEINSIVREQAANAREAAKCCCEAQVLAVQNQAKTDAGLATILANQACDSRVTDAVANANQNAKLDALLASRSGHGNG
jgi:hypothetical protein